MDARWYTVYTSEKTKASTNLYTLLITYSWDHRYTDVRNRLEARMKGADVLKDLDNSLPHVHRYILLIQLHHSITLVILRTVLHPLTLVTSRLLIISYTWHHKWWMNTWKGAYRMLFKSASKMAAPLRWTVNKW